MSILSYTYIGAGHIVINFACETDAKLIADELRNVPGIVDIKVDGRFWNKPHYAVHTDYIVECFGYFQDAVGFAEEHNEYTIVDQWSSQVYGPEEVKAMGF